MEASSPPPAPRRIVTTHKEAKSVVQLDQPITFQPYPNSTTSRFSDVWVYDGVPTNDNNLATDGGERKVTGPGLGVVQEGGVTCRYNDLAPGASVPMHRTTSTDVIVLISGQTVLTLDDGTETLLEKAGDSVVQRGTMHGWRNPSKTEWTRIMAIVVDAKPVVVDGAELKNEMQSE
ncbi:unnamed protein product [Peniophora sp. CBMAI 1063]|nr:unnamed protein product [Peniophora sp. CBMAI 1063]